MFNIESVLWQKLVLIVAILGGAFIVAWLVSRVLETHIGAADDRKNGR
jgi:hypothetical protein